MQLPIEAAKRIIDVSSVATAIIKRSGAVLYINDAFTKRFPETRTDIKLAGMFKSPSTFLTLLKNAAHTTSLRPALLTPVDDRKTVSVHIVPLDCTHSTPASLYMVTLNGRSGIQQKMSALKLEVEQTSNQKRRLMEHNRELQDTVKTTIPKLRELSYKDALTDLHNRRFYDSKIEQEWTRSQRGGDFLSLVLIDIDHFKRFNDEFGHPEGDTCLRVVAQALKSDVKRRFDHVCRIGGEEFALILPMTNAAGASSVAKRAVAVIEGLGIPQANGGVVTISAGVGTCIVQPGQSLATFAKRVDQTLYYSKRSGRNRMTHMDSMVACSESTIVLDERRKSLVVPRLTVNNPPLQAELPRPSPHGKST